MNKHSQFSSFFFDVTERLSRSTLCIAFERNDEVDPSLVRKLLGKDISPEETQAFQKMVDDLPARKYLEISIM